MRRRALLANSTTPLSFFGPITSPDLHSLGAVIRLYSVRFADSTWSCDPREGKKGRVTIAGEQYELAAGSVFLISSRDGPRNVEQLLSEDLGLRGGLDSVTSKLQALADTDPKFMAITGLAKFSIGDSTGVVCTPSLRVLF